MKKFVYISIFCSISLFTGCMAEHDAVTFHDDGKRGVSKPYPPTNKPIGSENTAGGDAMGTESKDCPALKNDFIEFPWPQEIESCYATNQLYDFNLNKCSPIPTARKFVPEPQFPDISYSCDWAGAAAVQTQFMGMTKDIIGIDEKIDNAKIVGCGEVHGEDRYMILLQYWYPRLEEIESCSVKFEWNIHTSCREALYSENSKELVWQECLQYNGKTIPKNQ